MYVKSFTVGGVNYNAVMASAVDQDNLLGLLTAGLMERGAMLAQMGEQLTDDALVPMFMAMPASTKQQVAAILMGKVVVNGTEQAVTVRDFSGKMVQYNQLLAELLRWNLSDFFTYMADVLKPVTVGQESQAQ
jgi:hypothetical protein